MPTQPCWSALALEAIADALLNFHEIAGAQAITVTIDLGGGEGGPGAHLSTATWGALFGAAGWEETQPAVCQRLRHPAQTTREILGHLGLGRPVARIWPRRKGTLPETRLTLYLKAAMAVPTPDDTRHRVAKLLDIAYRDEKRKRFAAATDARLGFNIHLFQDFLNLRPILEIVDPATTRVFLRQRVMPADAEHAVKQALAQRGFVTCGYSRVREIDRSAWDIDVLCSITEGAGHIVHCLGRQLVEAARLRGIATLVLQHGIRVQLPTDRFVEFGSDTHLSWGDEHATLLESTHKVAGLATTVGGGSPGDSRARDLPLGSPKFADSLLPGDAAAILERLGCRVSDFRCVVLVGTNLRWNAHKSRRASIIPALRHLIDQHPDVLFVLKPHPNERADDYHRVRRPNVRVVDDVVLTRMDLSISRLVRVADLVISSLSTLLLDAAVAGKPFLVFDTGNEFAYRHVQPIPFEQLHSLVGQFKLGTFLQPQGQDIERFKRHYAAADHATFYERLAELLSNRAKLQQLRRDDRAESAAAYSLCSVIEEFARAA
ncbi:MAG: hypothetical protein RLY70_4351 [Planctomycetota bacterium]|jgi:hypothetical protein